MPYSAHPWGTPRGGPCPAGAGGWFRLADGVSPAFLEGGL